MVGLVGTSERIPPEVRLLIAVVQDAVQVFRRGLLHTKGTRQRVEWREAAAWLLTETDDDRIGTLNWTCAHLGLEPGYIRRVALCGEPLPRLRHFVSRDPAGGNGPKPLRSAVGERS